MSFNNYFLTCGVGVAKDKLSAFDCALIDARVGDYNHVKVSSILPGNMIRYDSISLEKGSVLHSAYAHIDSNEYSFVLSACVAVGIPKDKNSIGVIMEQSGKFDIDVLEGNVINMVKHSMQCRGIEIEEILTAPITSMVPENNYLSVFSALVMW